MKYNVLILCEESQVEVTEFRRLGYETQDVSTQKE